MRFAGSDMSGVEVLGHRGHDRTCCWLDPVANDPEVALDHHGAAQVTGIEPKAQVCERKNRANVLSVVSDT